MSNLTPDEKVCGDCGLPILKAEALCYDRTGGNKWVHSEWSWCIARLRAHSAELEQSLARTEAHWRQELEAYKQTQPETKSSPAFLLQSWLNNFGSTNELSAATREWLKQSQRQPSPPCDCQKHTGHYPECVSQQTPPTPSFQFCVFDGPPPEGCADWYEWVAMPVHTRVFIRATTADDWKKPHEPNSYCRSRNCQEPRVKPFLYCAVHRQPDETEGSQS